MSYLHINNLYRPEAQTILLFKECYALEKIHGTSAHIAFTPLINNIKFFSGGASHVNFKALFNETALLEAFIKLGNEHPITVFGEAYGGKEQGMSATYGKELKFVAFDVKVGDRWLSVPDAEDVCNKLGIEFVSYIKVPTDIDRLNAERDRPSQQAIRNWVSVCETDGSITNPKFMEGVVLRPLVEMTLNNGSRVIAKHKRDEFRETKSPRVVDDPSKLAKLAQAESIANEWVVKMRLQHILDKLPGHDISMMPVIIKSMVEDVLREGKDEIDLTEEKAVRKAIGARTVKLYKEFLQTNYENFGNSHIHLF